MDTSKEYIEMCGKAEEIQVLKIKQVGHGEKLPLIEGDYVWEGNETLLISDDSRDIRQYNQHKPDFSIGLAGYCEGAGYEVTNLVWLPRQDQLQEMVYGENIKTKGLGWIMNQFYSFFIGDSQGEEYSSMEQMWLAYVMYEKFDKVWDGKEWIKKND